MRSLLEPEMSADLAPSAALSRLGRIQALLGVASAQLEIATAAGTAPRFLSGMKLRRSGARRDLEHHVRTSCCPLVIADADAVDDLSDDSMRLSDGSPVRFLAILPLGSVPGGPAHLLTLADIRPRSIDMANRLATLAMQLLHPSMTFGQPSGEIPDPHLLEQAAAHARFGVWQCDLPHNALRWTAGVYDIFGITRGSTLERSSVVTQYVDTSRAAMEEYRARALEVGSDFKLDAEIIRLDGQRRWMRLTGSVQTVNGHAACLFGTKQDVTAERRMIDKLRYLAETDALTGMASRALLQERLARPDGITALLLVDLDDFKLINDTLGHVAGDRCLREAAHRLRSCCSFGSMIGRFGGDEFAIILDTPHDRCSAGQLAHRIVQVMQLPHFEGTARVQLGASVGLALRELCSGEELFYRADQALYAAKAAGRGTSRTFDGSMLSREWFSCADSSASASARPAS